MLVAEIARPAPCGVPLLHRFHLVFVSLTSAMPPSSFFSTVFFRGRRSRGWRGRRKRPVGFATHPQVQHHDGQSPGDANDRFLLGDPIAAACSLESPAAQGAIFAEWPSVLRAGDDELAQA
ncbi:MAG: hypothetical protein U0610_27185 [bacterium]